MCYQRGVPVWFTYGPHIYFIFISSNVVGWEGLPHNRGCLITGQDIFKNNAICRKNVEYKKGNAQPH